MMKSIVCILGSPRTDGNTSVLVNAFSSSAQQSGATITTYRLSEMTYKGCQNLFACKTLSDRCGQSDDLTPVLESIINSDVVVLASPIYFTDVTGQLKLCLDRWFSFFVPGYATATNKSRLKSGKTIVLIQTQGEEASRYTDILDKYNHSFKWLGFTDSYLIQAAGVREIGDIEKCPDLIRKASDLGKRLAS